MLIPQNGRVIIIDDKQEQAFPLIKMLSKNKVPFTYHSDDETLLPDEPYMDIKLLFLDINLSADGAPEATIKSQLQNTLSRIVKPGTSYIAAIWSLKENEYQELLKDLFENIIPTLSPLVTISLTKSDFFDLDVNEANNEIIYTEKTDINLIEALTLKVESALNSIDAFEVILKWDNMVCQSASDVINDILSLAELSSDKNKKLKDIYYKLAEAMWGRQIVSANTFEIAQKATFIFNVLLSDKLDGSISKINYQLIADIKQPEQFEEVEKAMLNSKLLLNFDVTSQSLPGNVYQNIGETIENYPFNGLIADSLNIPLIATEFFLKEKGCKPENNSEAMLLRNELGSKYKKFEKSIREKIKTNSKFISLEISPICDYAQRKWKSNRICPGILWNTEYYDLIVRAENLYISPNLLVNETCYNMVLDLRYFTSYPFEMFKESLPIFRLKHSFLVDIQSLLSRHVNRPGITSIN